MIAIKHQPYLTDVCIYFQMVSALCVFAACISLSHAGHLGGYGGHGGAYGGGYGGAHGGADYYVSTILLLFIYLLLF
jgi:hypothetical protein